MGVLVGVKVDRAGAVCNVLRHGPSYGAGNCAGRHCSSVVVNGPVFAGNISFYVLCNRVHQANTAHQIGRNTEDGREHRGLVRHERRIFGYLLCPSFVQTIFQIIQIFSRSLFSFSVIEIIIDLYLVLIHIVIDGIGAAAHCGSVEGLCPGAVNIVDVVIHRVALPPPGRSEAYANPGCRLLCHSAGERFKVAVVLEAAVFFPSFGGPFPCTVFFHVLLQLVNVAVAVFFQQRITPPKRSDIQGLVLARAGAVSAHFVFVLLCLFKNGLKGGKLLVVFRNGHYIGRQGIFPEPVLLVAFFHAFDDVFQLCPALPLIFLAPVFIVTVVMNFLRQSIKHAQHFVNIGQGFLVISVLAPEIIRIGNQVCSLGLIL